MTCSILKKLASDSGGCYRGQPPKIGWRESLARWLMAGGFLALFLAGMPSVYAVNFEGCVFLDQNGNSTYDTGEPVQANAVVYLMDNQLVQAGLGGFSTTITGGDGCYYFFGNNASDFTIWIDIPSDMQQVTPVAGEVGQPAFYDLTVTNASQTVKVNFGLAGTTPTEIWSMRDDGVMVSNSDYVMLAKPNKDATEKTEMVVNRVGDTYQGDNQAAQVYVSPNDGTRSRRSNVDEFSILVGKNVSDTGEEIALDARVNPDNSVSFTDPTYPKVAVTAHPDGTYTGVDSESPSVNVAFDTAGNISATDSDDPTMSLLIDKATGKVTVTDSEYPTTTAGINPDGSYTITDEEFPNLIATVYANNEYVIQDILNNMVVRIDSQGNYMVIDNQNGVCVVLPNTRGLLSGIWKGITRVFSEVARFISKIAGFVADVSRFVVRVAQVISVVARVVATISQIAAILFPPLCPLFCAIASFAEGVARISDIVGIFASKVAMIAERIQAGKGFWVCNSNKRGVRDSTNGTVLTGKVSTTTDGGSDIPTLFGSAAASFLGGACKGQTASNNNNNVEPAPEQEITVIFKGNGGQVTSTPTGIDCKAVELPCPPKKVGTVTLTAIGENFKGWGGACAFFSNSRTCTLVANNTSKQVEADFGIMWPLAKNEIRGYDKNHRQLDDNSYCPETMIQGNVRGGSNPHGGWDFVAPIGTPIYSIADGEVEYTRYNSQPPCGGKDGGYGNCISISFKLDGSDYYAFYAHLDSIDVEPGKPVKKGDKIGTTGIAGNASSLPVDERHLHFEIRKNALSYYSSGIIRADPKDFYGNPEQYYEPNWKKISVSLTGNGAGQIVSNPARIKCPGGVCSKLFEGNVTLTATATNGSQFTKWGGNCSGSSPTCTLHADKATNTEKRVTAEFMSHNVGVTITGNGKVISNLPGINCPGGTCSNYFSSTVTLTATPSNGSQFKKWGGVCEYFFNSRTCTIQPNNSSLFVTAEFQ